MKTITENNDYFLFVFDEFTFSSCLKPENCPYPLPCPKRMKIKISNVIILSEMFTSRNTSFIYGSPGWGTFRALTFGDFPTSRFPPLALTVKK